jgi:hypothetical protein
MLMLLAIFNQSEKSHIKPDEIKYFVGFHSSFHNELFLPPLLPQPKLLVIKSCAWVFCETKSEIVASLDFNGFVLLFLV